MRYDFHLHTTMSDGKATPEALVFKAAARNLDVIAVTDHDTTAGCRAAVEEGDHLGVRVLPGVELSANVHVSGRSDPVGVHLICLGFALDDPDLERLLARIRAARVRSAVETAERLALAGYGIDPERVRAVAGRSLCRPHLADALVAAGHARSKQGAFDRFLSGDAYRTPYDLPSAEEAIATVQRAGGVAIYAHPRIEEIDQVAPALVDSGVDGFEVFRASWPTSPRPLYVHEWARHTDRLVSGGSDWHGTGTFGEFVLTGEQIPDLARRVA